MGVAAMLAANVGIGTHCSARAVSLQHADGIFAADKFSGHCGREFAALPTETQQFSSGRVTVAVLSRLTARLHLMVP